MPPPLFLAALGVGAAVGIGAFLIHKHRDDIIAFIEAHKRHNGRRYMHEMEESRGPYQDNDNDNKAGEEKEDYHDNEGTEESKKEGHSDAGDHELLDRNDIGVSSAIDSQNSDNTTRHRHRPDNARYFTPMENSDIYSLNQHNAETQSPSLDNHEAWKESIGVDNDDGDRPQHPSSTTMNRTISNDVNELALDNSRPNPSVDHVPNQAEEFFSDGGSSDESQGSWVELRDNYSEASEGSWSEIHDAGNNF